MKQLTKEEKQMLDEGVRDPDIVTEAKAMLFVLLAVLCAVLLAGAVYGIILLAEYIVKSLC